MCFLISGTICRFNNDLPKVPRDIFKNCRQRYPFLFHIATSGFLLITFGDVITIGSQVYLSTRRGAWILKKSSFQGVPADHLFLRRCLSFLLWLIPFNLYNWMMERIISVDLNHDLYGLRPKHRFLAQHPTLSDALPECLITGRVVLRKDIDHLTENGVVFKGN